MHYNNTKRTKHQAATWFLVLTGLSLTGLTIAHAQNNPDCSVGDSSARLKCLEGAVKPVRSFAPGGSGRQSARQDGLDFYRQYRAIARGFSGDKKALSNVHRQIRNILDPKDKEVVAGIADLGYELTTSGNGRIPMATDSSFESQAKGVIRWETLHYLLNASSRVGFSLGGDFGYRPTLVLWRPADQTTGALATSSLSVLHQQAFVWSFAPRLNILTGERGEFSLVGRGGQSVLASDVTAFKRGSTDVTLERVGSRSGKAASFFEAGTEYRFFTKSLEEAGIEKPSTYLSPVFSLGAGYRRDGRFAGLQRVDGFAGAQDRYYFRGAINLTNVVQAAKGSGDNPSSFSVKFAVEHDSPIHRGTVPSGTTITISSDIDVLKLLSGNQ